MDLTAAGFGASLTDVLPELRAQAESLMTLTLTAYSPNGWDNVDGKDVLTYNDEGTTPGKVQGTSATGRDSITRTVTVGGVDREIIDGGLHIPLSATVPVSGLDRGKGWEYEVTAVGPLDDPVLLGRRYLVTNVPAKSYATARRLDVVLVPKP